MVIEEEDFVVSSLFNRTDNLTLRRERNNCCPKSKLFSTQGYLRINFHGQPHMVQHNFSLPMNTQILVQGYEYVVH